jgi:Xaa-Pro aminopeptidase
MEQRLPRIPRDEYPLRWKKVQGMMREKKLDLLFAYADDRAVYGPAHIRWLADLPVHFEPVCILMFPTRDPILLCGPESDEYARHMGTIPDVRVLREFTHPDEDYPYSRIQGLAEIVSEVTRRPKSIRRVGLAGRGLMNAGLSASFQKALSSAKWLDAESDMLSLRSIKTPAEIAVIRHAYKIAEAGLAAAVKAIRPGISERFVAAEAEYAMRCLGSEGMGIDTIVASGPHTRPILARTTLRKIAKNDLVLLTLAPRYEGYHGAIGRPVLTGKPRAEIVKAVDAAARAQESCRQAIRAGIPGREVEGIGRSIMTEAGLGKYFPYSGIHSVGLIEFEAPIFGPSSTALLAPDMVISVDIPMFNTPFGAGLRMEDGYRITRTKPERLNRTPYLIRK